VEAQGDEEAPRRRHAHTTALRRACAGHSAASTCGGAAREGGTQRQQRCRQGNVDEDLPREHGACIRCDLRRRRPPRRRLGNRGGHLDRPIPFARPGSFNTMSKRIALSPCFRGPTCQLRRPLTNHLAGCLPEVRDRRGHLRQSPARR
jgi:hypothetical protein